ncbi:uncharacterized protein [Haliotis asinina]|uniref:uncharacterized protein n=1 Tax=Haliotis asinina TaxID=109174 RepID=UPI003531E911
MVTSWIITFLLFYMQDLVFGLGEESCYSKIKGHSYNCEYGCCGSTNDQKCCDPLSMIVGIGIGCVILVATIIAIIVCCIKQQTRNRRRLQPRQNEQVTIVSQAKGPPAYPGHPYVDYYQDSYKGPIPRPPPRYQPHPNYPPPMYVPPDQQLLYGDQADKVQPPACSGTVPPPPYSSN